MNEELVCTNIINYTSRTQIKNVGDYLNKVRLRWENTDGKIVQYR
jgi:hypothetical protein